LTIFGLYLEFQRQISTPKQCRSNLGYPNNLTFARKNNLSTPKVGKNNLDINLLIHFKEIVAEYLNILVYFDNIKTIRIVSFAFG
jgi:hypothetical protein